MVKKLIKRLSNITVGSIFLAVAVLFVSCASRDQFTQLATTQYFVQNYNPQYIDVLWMVDNRSPMYRVRDHLISEASNFFTRLDAIPTGDYQMGFVSADMVVNPGQLEPIGDPIILTKGLGTLTQRTETFAAILSQQVNLQVGATDQGFDSVWTVMNESFQPRAGVPLVLVYISDSDDHSPVPTGQDAVQVYANYYLSLKNNDPSLLKVYSINYEPLNGQTATDSNRCATFDDADIDMPGFQNRYFRLAQYFNGSTADLCGSFSSQIDLTGLQMKQLPSSFTLQQTPEPTSILITVFFAGTGETVNTSWTYNASSNQIVFASAPPEGSTIEVTFIPGS